MADDDKVAKDGQTPADPPPVTPSAQTFEQATIPRNPSPAPKSDDSKSEWTVSDARGPLSTADSEVVEHAAKVDPALASGPIPLFGDTSGPPGPGHEAFEPAHAPPQSAEHASAGAKPEPAPDTPHRKSDTAASRPMSVVQEAKRPLLPIAAGLVIGAAIGAGSAAFVYRSVQNDVMPEEVSRLSSRVDALEKRPDAGAGVAGLKQNVADLEEKVAGLHKGGQAPTDLAPLQTKLSDLQTSLDALKGQVGDAKAVETKLAGLEAAVNGMKTAASSAQASVVAVQGEQKQLAGRVMVPALAVVADSLVQQINQGQPYISQVDALAALGADPVKIAILRQNAASGVPAAKVLAAKFEPLAEPLVTTVHHAPANAGFVDRLKSGMMNLVSVRRADDLSGTDPASRVALIKSDLAHDDVAAALVVWDGLPAEAKAKGEAWRALAKTHADAMTAARGLQHDAIAALGTKKP